MGPILELAAARGLAVIEDAAQAIGATWQGRPAGAMGDVGALSFYPTKNLGGAGDGGACLTNDDALADSLRALRVHGSRQKYVHTRIGINSRLDTLQAAILGVKLRHLDSWALARRNNAARYAARFQELGVAPRLGLPAESPSCDHVFNQYVIHTAHRDELRAFLQDRGIGTEIYYPIPLHLQECFAYLGHRPGDFPNAERAAAESLALPIYPELPAEAIDQVVDTIALFLKSRG